MKRLTELTIEDVIQILLEFDVQHQELPAMQGRLYGLIDYGKKKIYLDSTQDSTEMRDSILHEFYHAKARQQMMNNSENAVDKITKQHIKKLYGEK